MKEYVFVSSMVRLLCMQMLWVSHTQLFLHKWTFLTNTLSRQVKRDNTTNPLSNSAACTFHSVQPREQRCIMLASMWLDVWWAVTFLPAPTVIIRSTQPSFKPLKNRKMYSDGTAKHCLKLTFPTFSLAVAPKTSFQNKVVVFFYFFLCSANL